MPTPVRYLTEPLASLGPTLVAALERLRPGFLAGVPADAIVMVALGPTGVYGAAIATPDGRTAGVTAEGRIGLSRILMPGIAAAARARWPGWRGA